MSYHHYKFIFVYYYPSRLIHLFDYNFIILIFTAGKVGTSFLDQVNLITTVSWLFVNYHLNFINKFPHVT